MHPRKGSINSISTTAFTVLETECELGSVLSDETLDAAAIPIFRKPILTYTKLREFPVVTGLLKSEILLYPSLEALQDGKSPLFSAQLNKLHFMKKNSPILTSYIYENGLKFEYCKIYFKILHNNLTCYVLQFSSGQNRVIYNNALKPHCDTSLKDTNLRIFGASGASSTFGNAAMKMFVLDRSSSSLVDGMDEIHLSQMRSIKDFKVSNKQKQSQLYKAVVDQKRNEVLRILSLAAVVASIPFATFIDHGSEKIEGLKVQGTIRLYESTTESEEGISDDSLVLATMMLTLVEQELLKMRGNNKPSLINHFPENR